MMSNPPIDYLDANVVLAYLNNEPGRAADVAALFEEAERGDIRLVTSVITLAEVAYIKETNEQSDPSVDATINDLLANRRLFTLIDCTADIVRNARRYVRPSADGKRLRLPDAIHLSSAEAARVSRFLTYDSDFEMIEPDVDFEITKPTPARPRLDLREETI